MYDKLHPVELMCFTFFESNFSKKKVRLYPNPTTGEVYLEFEKPLERVSTIQILDHTGRKIASYPIIKGQSKSTIQMEDYTQGLYFLRLFDSQQVLWSGKLIKE